METLYSGSNFPQIFRFFNLFFSKLNSSSFHNFCETGKFEAISHIVECMLSIFNHLCNWQALGHNNFHSTDSKGIFLLSFTNDPCI